MSGAMEYVVEKPGYWLWRSYVTPLQVQCMNDLRVEETAAIQGRGLTPYMGKTIRYLAKEVVQMF
jgi:hypothetical protein